MTEQTADPTLDIGKLSLNDCRTICRALKLRAGEITKVAKKCRELDRQSEAQQLEREAGDIASRLGPKFDSEGSFNFLAGPNEKKPKESKDPRQKAFPFGRGRGKGKRAPRDLAEEAHDQMQRGGR
jgi:hypothetical protein